MDLFTIARKVDEKGNVEYQIGGNASPALALQMIFEASMAIAKAEGIKQAEEEAALKVAEVAAKLEEEAKKAAKAAKKTK